MQLTTDGMDCTRRAALEARITATMIALAGVPSISGEEAAVRQYVRERLGGLGLAPVEDGAGNLIARVPGAPKACDGEPPLLLNAHLDRVPPGLGHTPILENGILRGDGTTNLGADDSSGIAVILHVVEELHARELPHPPLLLLFTVGEEVGLVGAKAFDTAMWGVPAAMEGIVFDNAGEAGVVVTHAATYIAFDVVLRGSGGHPGKRLEGTASAVEMFRCAHYPCGELDGGATRVSIGRIEGGTARNAVPREVRVQGEARTLLEGEARAALLAEIELAFVAAAASLGGSAEVRFDPHCDGYIVDEREPLLQAYAATLAARGQELRTMTTFIGSDASALRHFARVFTVSTGVMDEHTPDEWIDLAPLADLAETAIALLSTYRAE
jgi:tripeptide aminopeptidase